MRIEPAELSFGILFFVGGSIMLSLGEIKPNALLFFIGIIIAFFGVCFIASSIRFDKKVPFSKEIKR